jgi:hypothetical protein
MWPVGGKFKGGNEARYLPAPENYVSQPDFADRHREVLCASDQFNRTTTNDRFLAIEICDGFRMAEEDEAYG